MSVVTLKIQFNQKKDLKKNVVGLYFHITLRFTFLLVKNPGPDTTPD